MTTLGDAFRGVSHLGIDTAPFIYFVEAYPRYDELVTEIFRRIDEGAILGVTSSITLTEVLIHPLQAGDAHLAQEYRDLLLHSEHLATYPVDAAVAERAADLRARYRLRIPDALQIAVALEAGCQAYLTNDAAMQRVGELSVLILDDLQL